MGEFSKGDKVRVDRPAWRDATGRNHAAGADHGRTAIVVGTATDTNGHPYQIGRDVMVDVRFETGRKRRESHWSSDLVPVN